MGSRHLAHSPATGAVALTVASTPSETDSRRTFRSRSAPSGIHAMPVWRYAGAGAVRVSVRADPGPRSRPRVSKTSGLRGSVRALAVRRDEGMANSGSEQFVRKYFTGAATGSPTLSRWQRDCAERGRPGCWTALRDYQAACQRSSPAAAAVSGPGGVLPFLALAGVRPSWRVLPVLALAGVRPSWRVLPVLALAGTASPGPGGGAALLAGTARPGPGGVLPFLALAGCCQSWPWRGCGPPGGYCQSWPSRGCGPPGGYCQSWPWRVLPVLAPGGYCQSWPLAGTASP